MLEDKITYYIAKINNIQKSIEIENDKIFQYENMLLEEKKKQEDRGFFTRLFIRNKFISSIEKILKEHHKESENLDYLLKIEIQNFINIGVNEIENNKKENSNNNVDNDLIKKVNYISNFISIIGECQIKYDTATDRLKRLVQNSSYTSIEEYKSVYDLLKSVILKIETCYNLINEYKLFSNDIEKITHSVKAILLCDKALQSISKYKEIKDLRLEFENMNINLKFLKTTFHLLQEEYNEKLEKLSETKDTNLNDYKILFINKLRNEHNLDLSKYQI